jgi:hypothetical protein
MSRFVFIDKDPAPVITELQEALGTNAVHVITYPTDLQGAQAAVAKAELEESIVVLMDLDLYGDDVPIFSLNPSNGLALEESVRGWLIDTGAQPLHQHRAYVLFSHELGKVAGNLGPTDREHVIARKTGNEWVTSKNAANRTAIHQELNFLQTLAASVENLPQVWATGEALRGQVMAFLGLQGGGASSWHESAAEDAERYGIPLQSISEGVEMKLIRWLLHVALPFPSCFLRLSDIALMLRLDPGALETNHEARASLTARMQEFAYAGPLHDFFGPRWWAVGIRRFRQDIGREADAAGRSIPEHLGAQAIPVAITHPVPVVDNRFVRGPGYDDIAKCVRVLSDDWPDEVEHPWMTIETATSAERLIGLVHPEDRYRLPE